MKHNFKKATSILLAALTTLMVCLQPVKVSAIPSKPGVRVCQVADTEITLPPIPKPTQPH